VNENVLAGLALDESKALARVKPLNCSFFFQLCFLFYVRAIWCLPTPFSAKKWAASVDPAAPSSNLKVLQEQQTQEQSRTFPRSSRDNSLSRVRVRTGMKDVRTGSGIGLPRTSPKMLSKLRTPKFPKKSIPTKSRSSRLESKIYCHRARPEWRSNRPFRCVAPKTLSDRPSTGWRLRTTVTFSGRDDG
jgi:hypothetical protein